MSLPRTIMWKLWILAALMAYKTVVGDRKVQKNVHMFLNLIAFILGAVGVRAVFKYHDMVHIQDMYSLHSWIGISTICAFGLQVTFESEHLI